MFFCSLNITYVRIRTSYVFYNAELSYPFQSFPDIFPNIVKKFMLIIFRQLKFYIDVQTLSLGSVYVTKQGKQTLWHMPPGMGGPGGKSNDKDIIASIGNLTKPITYLYCHHLTNNVYSVVILFVHVLKLNFVNK